MLYFAYGSNMSMARLRARTPSAVLLGQGYLKGHDLRFHMQSLDGSGKCDAYLTSDDSDVVFGAVYKIDPSEKPILDQAEGLGNCYDEKYVSVQLVNGPTHEALIYVAMRINQEVKPYSWYLNHVMVGASEMSLPDSYVKSKIQSVISIEDLNSQRDAEQRAIHL